MGGTQGLFGTSTVDPARVVIDPLDSNVEEVALALGGSREHDDAPSS